jgi:hypothetical protein
MYISDSAVLSVVPNCVNVVSINPIIQSKARLIGHAHPLHVTIYYLSPLGSIQFFCTYNLSSDVCSVTVLHKDGESMIYLLYATLATNVNCQQRNFRSLTRSP